MKQHLLLPAAIFIAVTINAQTKKNNMFTVKPFKINVPQTVLDDFKTASARPAGPMPLKTLAGNTVLIPYSSKAWLPTGRMVMTGANRKLRLINSHSTRLK